MKVKDWRKEIERQQERMLTCPYGSVEESLVVDNHDIKVVLGGDHPGLYIDGARDSFYSSSGKEFTALFRKHQDIFEALLEKIKERVDKIVEASTALLNLVIQEDVPELVLEKLAGGDVGNNPSELLQTIAKKKFEKLGAMLEGIVNCYTQTTYEKKIAGKGLRIADRYGNWELEWGNFSITFHNSKAINTQTGNTQESLLLIGNYEKLEKEVKLFVESMKAASRVLKGGG